MIKKIILKLFTKVDKNIVYISSFGGKYSDSPKYISQQIYKIDKTKQIYWLIDDLENKNIPNYVKIVKKNSWQEMKLQYKAKIIIDNVYGCKSSTLNSNSLKNKIEYIISKWIKYKKNQKIYTTWHGTPLKKMGRDQIGNKTIDWSCPNTTMILGNKYTLRIMDHITFGKLNMKLIGIPRNDILFDNSINIEEIKQRLNLPLNKKILLYAPTFRTDAGSKSQNIERSGLNQINEFNFTRLNDILKSSFGGEWAFVCRFHYHVEKKVDWENINKKYDNMVINGNQCEDMAEYLKCADILITDISSSIFDFCLTKKPSFIYFPDLNYYTTQERGLYLDINTLPFQVATNIQELENNIINFKEKNYIKKVEKFNNKLEYVNLNSNSSKKIAEFILEDSKSDNKN